MDRSTQGHPSRGEMRTLMPLPTYLSTRSGRSGGLTTTYPTGPAHGEEFAAFLGREFGGGLVFRARSTAALHCAHIGS